MQLLHITINSAIVTYNYYLMDIKERLNKLIEKKGIKPKELEEKTGVDRMKWANLKRGTIRAQQEHIEAVVKLWPEYAYWITTGLTIPEAGQISPEVEEVRDSLGLRTGTD